ANASLREGAMSSARRGAFTLVSIIVAVIAMSAVGLYAQDNPYRVVEDWAKLPEGRTWGSTAAVDVDANDHIWLRSDAVQTAAPIRAWRRSSNSTHRAGC